MTDYVAPRLPVTATALGLLVVLALVAGGAWAQQTPSSAVTTVQADSHLTFTKMTP